MLPLPALLNPPVIGQDNERLLGEEKRRGERVEAKVLFSLGISLKRERRSTSDSRQNSACVNELSHTLGSAEQEEKGDLGFLFLTLLLHAV